MNVLRAIYEVLKESLSQSDYLTSKVLKEVLFALWLWMPIPILAALLTVYAHPFFIIFGFLTFPWMIFWIKVEEKIRQKDTVKHD